MTSDFLFDKILSETPSYISVSLLQMQVNYLFERAPNGKKWVYYFLGISQICCLPLFFFFIM